MINEEWELRYMYLAHRVAEWSDDPSTKVGCVAVKSWGLSGHTVQGTGYNTFPPGVRRDKERLENRDQKLLHTIHAEQSVISNMARGGISTRECSLYVTHQPCTTCAVAIIQAGFYEVIYPLREVPERWKTSFKAAREMLDESQTYLRSMEQSDFKLES